MFTKHDRSAARVRRHTRVRKNLAGTPQKPRLSVFRSLHHITAQVIDDSRGHTIASASTQESTVRERLSRGAAGVGAATLVGRVVAERALAAGAHEVVFDRGGYLYHGRVKALADAAREAGLKF